MDTTSPRWQSCAGVHPDRALSCWRVSASSSSSLAVNRCSKFRTHLMYVERGTLCLPAIGAISSCAAGVATVAAAARARVRTLPNRARDR
jgi:hypothetical protein